MPASSGLIPITTEILPPTPRACGFIRGPRPLGHRGRLPDAFRGIPHAVRGLQRMFSRPQPATINP